MKPEKQTLHYSGRVVSLSTDEVVLPNGHRAVLEVVHHPGGAAVAALDESNRVCLLRQYRYVADGWLWELPAGKLEPHEPPLATAQRELIEECGYEAREWWHIASMDPTIGYSDEVIHLYGAKDLVHVGAKLDVGEHLECFAAKFDDALEWVHQGIISDSKTTFALLWWRQWGRFPSR